jgi:hypothetical protein
MSVPYMSRLVITAARNYFNLEKHPFRNCSLFFTANRTDAIDKRKLCQIELGITPYSTPRRQRSQVLVAATRDWPHRR